MRGLEQIGALGLVAGGAYVDLSRGALNWIFVCVQCVTAGAGDIRGGMRTCRPVVGGIALMATQAHGVLFGCRRAGLGTKINHARQRTAAGLNVCTARTMTGLALQPALSERTPAIPGTRVLGVKQARDGRIAMATQTGIGTLRAVPGIGRVWRGDRWGRSGSVERMHLRAGTQHQSESGQHSGTRRAPHSIHRGGDVVHDPHVGDATGTMAEPAGLNQRRNRAEDRPPFSIFQNLRRTAVLLHVCQA